MKRFSLRYAMRRWLAEGERVNRINEKNETAARAAGYPNLISMQQEEAGEQYPEIMYAADKH